MTLKDLLASAEIEGYWEGAPGEAAEIDGPICKYSTCRCGNVGMAYHPFVNKSGSYRAFASCPMCHELEEF